MNPPRWLPLAATVLLAAVWVWLHLPSLALLPGDEPLYLLDAKLWLDGRALYHDVFLAHPPLRIWQAAAVLAVGAPVAWAKIWSLLAPLCAAAALHHVARTRGGSGAALLTIALFLYANVLLTYGALFVGVEQAMAATALLTVVALSGRWLLAGLLLGLSTQWALHVALVAVPVAWWAWRAGQLSRLVVGVVLGLVPLIAELAWYGQPMLDQVFAYHLRKVTHMAAQKSPARLLPFLQWHAPLIALNLAAVWRGSPVVRQLALSGLTVLGLLLLWPRLQAYYFLLPVPWLALAGGLALADWLPRLSVMPRLVVVVVLVGGVLVPVPEALGRRAQNDVAREEMTQLAAQVQQLAAGRPLWGDGALVPLLSLRTGLPIALGDTDLNAQRFASGLTPPGPHLDRVLAQKPLIVLVPRHGVDLVPVIHDRLLAICDVVAHFNAPRANFAGLLLTPR